MNRLPSVTRPPNAEPSAATGGAVMHSPVARPDADRDERTRPMSNFIDSSKSMILRLLCMGWRQVFGGSATIIFRKRNWQAVVFADGNVVFVR